MNALRLVVYTCITAGYDDVRQPAQVDDGVDYVFFTDTPGPDEGAWTRRTLPSLSLASGSPASRNRFVKMHPHILFPQHDASVYVDGHVTLLGGVGEAAASALSRRAIALYRHPFRNCAYDEARVCSDIGYAWHWRIAGQMRAYRDEGFPRAFDFHEAGVIFRRHDDAAVQQLMHAWWAAYQGGVKRDQLSLPYLMWRHGVPVEDLGRSDARFIHRHFRLDVHHKRSIPLWIRARGVLNRTLLSPFSAL